MSIINRLSIKRFRDCIYVLPLIACDKEMGMWGYPGCVWVTVGWLRWSVQVALYTRPCYHCFGYATAAKKGASE